MRLKAGWLQLALTGSAQDNLAAATEGIRRLGEQGADLIVLPELHTTPYFCQAEDPALFDLAEKIPGPVTEALGAAAAAAGAVVVGSVFEKRTSGIYHNTAVVLEKDGSLAGIYRKMHIPDDPGYYEKFYFTPGDGGFRPVVTSVGKLGVLVCWDQWYPEAARLMALAGADLLIYPTAIGWDAEDSEEEQARQLDAWRTVQRGHAVANGLPVIAVNRCGYEAARTGEGGIHFWGNSFTAGCQGEFLSQAGTDQSSGITALDLSATERVRRIWPFLRDRRIDAYTGLLERFCDRKEGSSR